jgi:hypothetical protein
MNATIGANATANNNTQTVYTAPANGYAIVQIYCETMAATSGRCSVGTRTISGLVSNQSIYGVYIGPSTALTVTSASAANVTINVSGVEFLNTP